MSGSRQRSVIFVQYTRPAVYPPLERAAALFARANWSVLFLGIELHGDANAIKLEARDGVREELWRPSSSKLLRKFSYAGYVLWCLKRILTARPDVVYCSDGYSYVIGYVATWIPGLEVVMHEHDPPAKTVRGPAALLTRFRRRFAQRADVCVIPQDERAAKFRSETASPRTVVAYNCPLRVELLDAKSMCDAVEQPDKRPLRLWYHGSLSPGQFPPMILSAMKACDAPITLRFAGYETVSNPDFVETFLAKADELGLSGQVRYLGAIPERAKLLAEAARADVGLTLFASRFRDPMVGASNKPFDYLGCGLALLTNATDEWIAFFEGRGVSKGCIPEDCEDVARALSWFYANPDERRAMGRRGRRLIEAEWNYDEQFAKVMAALPRCTPLHPEMRAQVTGVDPVESRNA